MLDKWPMQFLIWNLNEDTGIFWTDLSTLEEHDDMVNGLRDPWLQKINLRQAKRKLNGGGDIIAFEVESEYQGYPTTMIVINE